MDESQGLEHIFSALHTVWGFLPNDAPIAESLAGEADDCLLRLSRIPHAPEPFPLMCSCKYDLRL